MYTLLMVLCIFGIILGPVIALFMLEDAIEYIWIPILVILISGFGLHNIVTNDAVRAANGEGDIKTEYAKIVTLNQRTLGLDNDSFKVDVENAVTQKYPLNLQGFKEGDIVRYDYISTDLSNYLIGIEKIK